MSLAYVPLHSLRRAFVAATFALVGSFVSPASFAWDLTILHVNDVHSAAAGVNDRGPVYDDTDAVGGLARVTALVADEKAKAKVQGKAVLALDAGDFWQGTHFFRTGGMPWAREAMRRMPWDAVTLGNHEFDLGCETLAWYVKALPFPVLAANLEKNPACQLSTAPLPATVVKDFDGVKVGIIGLANDEGKDISEACPETNFADRAAALRRAAAELEKAGVTHIIAVTHVGYEADQALASAVPAIDVIVGGHTHSVLGYHPHSEGPYPTVIPHDDGSQTLVVQAGRSTRYLGRLSVSFDDAGRIVQFKGDLEELVPSLRRDKAMHEFVERSLEAIRADQERFVGVNTSTLPDGLDPCREGDCRRVSRLGPSTRCGSSNLERRCHSSRHADRSRHLRRSSRYSSVREPYSIGRRLGRGASGGTRTRRLGTRRNRPETPADRGASLSTESCRPHRSTNLVR